MNELCLFLFIIANIITVTVCKDVLGCGGFLKSHVSIDFSKIEVKLLTKQGILKDRINCAPNNGYYFVPLYDKGEYILELEPPPGWSFTPTKVDLVVDGINDLCSQGKDIDFVFNGFGITGKVESLGNVNGPEGVEVELVSSNEVKKTITSKGGDFFFTPVYPGSYVVKISNSKWKVWKDTVKVIVTEGNTELPTKSLVIQGYPVVGSVKNKGEPIKNTVIILFSSEKTNVEVDGCDKSPLPAIKTENKFLCHVKSDENGLFKFDVVPNGQYIIKPHDSGQNVYYQPDFIKFTVEHESVILENGFEVVGFNTTGRVLNSVSGIPLRNVKVFLNGKEVAQTNSDGIYNLEKIQAGSYTLKPVAAGLVFDEVTLKISPNSKQLPDLVPSAYEVCGTVISDKSQTVTFTKIGSTKFLTTLSDANSGKFCEFLTPGKYQVQVVVDSGVHKGLQFFPNVQTIEVGTNQAKNIIFSQLKATVTGKVQCIQKKDCTALKAILRPGGETTDKNDITINVVNGEYKTTEIYPGMYDIILSENKLCWKNNKQSVNVNNVNIEVPPFFQIGYSVVFMASHDTQVLYKLPGQPEEKVFNVPKGVGSHCLEKPGVYTFNIDSCHSYDTKTKTYDTDSPIGEVVHLNALKHTNTLLIQCDKKYDDITATININGIKTDTGSLPFTKNGYEINLLLGPNENAVIILKSDILYFNPPILSIQGGNDCVNLGPKFKAVLGVVFKGKIIPPLSGVSLTVESENSDTLMAESDANGLYKFPPLDKTKTYKLSAKKESYVIVGPNEEGDFLAHKLAEISIEVVDILDKSPLQGALLSLSGGDSYRSNLQTDENGKITFNSLSPGEYFLRPMMKEYSFEPSSKLIKVNEGQTVEVKLTGKRVAYSVYGQVTSLNKEREENVVVLAQGVGNCSHFSEEQSSDSSGQFRIRGLQPFCSYDIVIKQENVDKPQIERSAPKKIHIPNVTGDVKKLKLAVFRPINNLDLLVKVFAKNPEHYKSLKLKVLRDSHSVFFTSRIDTSNIALSNDYNFGVLVQVPPIPIDGKTYSVSLESNLNNKLEPEPEYFVANSSFQYVELEFRVKSNVTEQDIKQTSVWTLVSIFGVMIVVYNIDKVSQVAKDKLGGYVSNLINSISKRNVSGTNEYTIDNVDIDQIVQSINDVKRKPKPKKVQ